VNGGDETGADGFADGFGDAAKAGIDCLDRLMAAGRLPVWPTMSGLA